MATAYDFEGMMCPGDVCLNIIYYIAESFCKKFLELAQTTILAVILLHFAAAW